MVEDTHRHVALYASVGSFAATLRERAEAVAVYPLSSKPADIKRIAEGARPAELPVEQPSVRE